jgi:hypothetical protein
MIRTWLGSTIEEGERGWGDEEKGVEKRREKGAERRREKGVERR